MVSSDIPANAVAIVVGVGASAGLGAGLARRIAAGGLEVYLAARTAANLERVAEEVIAAGGKAHAVATDSRDESEVAHLFDVAQAGGAPIDLVVYNAGGNLPMPMLETPTKLFEAMWRSGCLGGFLVGREAAGRMLAHGRGTILFTGASASLRGKANFAHFAAAKAGLRAVSQSMAREFGPRGLHVAHIVIDGAINGERVNTRFPDMAAEKGVDGMLDIDAIAEAFWQVYRQHPSAWSQEIDLRPYKEPF